MAYLYRHIRLDKNEPFYVGIGEDSPNKFGKYIRAKKKQGRNNLWKKITNKTSYKIEIMLDDLTWEEACQKEIEFISLYGRINLKTGILCNMTEGGDGIIGFKHSEDTKIKMRKPKPEGFGEKIRQSRIGTKESEETISKRRETSTGRKRTEEQKQRMRKPKLTSKKGKEHGSFGKNRSEQCIINRSKPILQYDLKGNFIKEWVSATEAFRYFKKGDIRSCCINRQKTACGYIWKFKNEPNG